MFTIVMAAAFLYNIIVIAWALNPEADEVPLGAITVGGVLAVSLIAFTIAEVV